MSIDNKEQALQKEAILTKKSHKLIFKESSKNDESDYGMGWFLGDGFAHHSGGWMGTNTFTKRWLD